MKIKRMTISILGILLIILLSVSLIDGCTSPSTSAPPATQAPAKTTAAPASTAPAALASTAPATSAPASSQAASDQKVYTMNIQLAHQRSQYMVTQAQIPFAQTLEQRSNGRLKVNLYDQGSVVANPQVISSVASGTIQGAWVLSAWVPGQFPLDDIFSLPLLYPSATIGGQTVTDVYQKFPEFAKQWPAGVKVMTCDTTGLLQLLMVNKQVKTAADLKGLKIFGLDPISLKYITLLGANPTTLAMVSASDFYLAFQRNMGDGAFFSFAAVKSSKLNEVCKYVTVVNTSCNPFYFIVNQSFYDSLPADLKKILDEETGFKLAESTGKGLDQGTEIDAKWASQNGMTFSKLSDAEIANWKTVFKPMQDDLIKQLAGKGYSAQTLQSVMDEINSYSAQAVKNGAYISDWSPIIGK